MNPEKARMKLLGKCMDAPLKACVLPTKLVAEVIKLKRDLYAEKLGRRLLRTSLASAK